MKTISVIAAITGIIVAVKEHRRMKYEVFGIVLTADRGSMGVDTMQFRSEKKALRYYNRCRKRYGMACISKI